MKVERFLKAWDEKESIEHFLMHYASLPPAELVHEYLASLPQLKQDAIKSKLEEIATNLTRHVDILKKDIDIVASEIKQRQENAEACASYEKAGDTDKQ